MLILKDYSAIWGVVNPAMRPYRREKFHTILKSPILGWALDKYCVS